ncbi:hypothetical protein LOK49_Contig264G00004 [Camellia lanceoleosa]|nr:hypothetical protein LOK49_Contig264G00004 [Camellia lanceoleosa]
MVLDLLLHLKWNVKIFEILLAFKTLRGLYRMLLRV